LTDEKVAANFDIAGDDHAGQVAYAKAWPYLGIDTDVDAVLEVELSLQPFGVSARKTIP